MISRELYQVLLARFGGKSDFEGFRIIAGDYLTIGLSIAFCEMVAMKTSGLTFAVLYFLNCVVLASRYRAFEILVHEASHNNVFATSKFNRQMQFLFAFPVFLHVQTYAKIHLEHHQLIGDFSKDPDILIYKKWGLDKLPERKWWVLYVRPLTLYFTWDHMRSTFLNFWRNPADRWQKLSFWLVVILVLTLFQWWTYFLIYFFVPFYLLLPVFRFYARANEHTGVDFSVDHKSARNNLGFLHRFILHPHGDGYHQVHHLAASVPFYNLPRAHKFLVENNIEFLDSYNPITSARMMEKGCTDVLANSKSVLSNSWQ